MTRNLYNSKIKFYENSHKIVKNNTKVEEYTFVKL